MKKILFFVLSCLVCIFNAAGAVRGENTSTRGKTNTAITVKSPSRSISNRSAVKKNISARTPTTIGVLKSRSTKSTATPKARTTTRSSAKSTRRAVSTTQNVITRAATQTGRIDTDTRTGSAYEQCKTAFFTCMDQFCELKNDAYKRCSCNDRVFKFQDIFENYQNVSERLTEFTENLDTVALTKEQATAMKTATEGEDALTEDKSASKQLLQAIMNAIQGEDSTVGGKYKNLNSLVISPDMSNAFGMSDYGQIIAAYNGANLYKAVYPKCRTAVKEDCNDASLQRAVNAYLMAIEQDCNTVESALVTKQKQLKSATYKNSAMLDLARVENRQNHNSDDVATCLVNVEKAIQSEEVCGAGYHKCLDTGQYIDVTTGAPLKGVKDFYKLGTLLTFKNNENIQNQKLSSLANNQQFVNFFENKTKKFAKDALDRCTEKADTVWREYLDRALLDIYYAQQSKVKTIQNSCFSLVAACYDDQKASITEAMSNLTGDSASYVQASAIALTNEICKDYIESCNNMFVTLSGDVVKKYMENKAQSDIETACRDVVQKCFDGFGGTNYENFYYVQNGLIEHNTAIEWFTLYDCSTDDTCDKTKYISPCANELAKTENCNNQEIIEHVFGGLDKYGTSYKYQVDINTYERNLRPTGVASEIYYKIIDTLATQCEQLHGYFIEPQFAEFYNYISNNACLMKPIDELDNYYHFKRQYYTSYDNSEIAENMCPAGYIEKIDVQSWGACSCWENGNYRSKNGQLNVCQPILPISDDKASMISVQSDTFPTCTNELLPTNGSSSDNYYSEDLWCLQYIKSENGQICPYMYRTSDLKYCADSTSTAIDVIEQQDLHNLVSDE